MCIIFFKYGFIYMSVHMDCKLSAWTLISFHEVVHYLFSYYFMVK